MMENACTNTYDANMIALRARYPELAARVEAVMQRGDITVFKARDGGIAYGVRVGAGVRPLTDPVAPLARIRSVIQTNEALLNDETRPVLVVGLYPGNELLYIFDRVESISTPHCPQPVWVCIDSAACLHAFLLTWDARRILESPRVQFFRHEDIPARVEYLSQHPEFPHHFALVSGAPDAQVEKLIPPFVELITARERELPLLLEENNLYYDGMDDARLTHTVAGRSGRRPRLLMPTVSWSTFVQHSTRDTCRAFEALGWQTQILKVDGMLTPYCLARAIRDFKPDVFLFIDHMRYEAEAAYPRNLMFVTWIQDDMPNLQCATAGGKLGEYAARSRRDLVAGYTTGLKQHHGFPADRLVELKIPADNRIFHPVALTHRDLHRYGCQVAFMSNVSTATEQVVESLIAPAVAPAGIGAPTLREIHDLIWCRYREGRTYIEREALLTLLMRFPEFRAAWTSTRITGPSNEDIFRLLYWRLNDVIYRHVVLEWAQELNLDLALYGHGWEEHPRFARHARGPLQHGAELNKAYQAAGVNLHLNITQGMHQRIREIRLSGGRLLAREASAIDLKGEPTQKVMQAMGTALASGLSLRDAITGLAPADRTTVADWAFRVARGPTVPAGGPTADATERITAALHSALTQTRRYMIPGWERMIFDDKPTFAQRIQEQLS